MESMIALQMVEDQGFTDVNGEFKKLHSSVSRQEIQFLGELIRKCRPDRTLEIGCAYGVSSLAICESIGPEAHHTILDPFQSTDWEGNGLHNLKKAGFTNYRLLEERSEFALPRLCEEGATFDFAFVDGWHTFDHALVEFFYIDRMLPVGGIVAFDDSALVGLNKLMRYISRYPHYECLGTRGETEYTVIRKAFNQIKRVLGFFTLPMGGRLRSELLSDTVVRPDAALDLSGSMTAFRKTSVDRRGCAWYETF